MKTEDFQFSTMIANRRKELKVTQEEIAEHVGVSRAAVSKWEKGLSYPDITLLPKLATYFNISIDTLLGYKPQLTKEQISRTYTQLAQQFSQKAFEDVEKSIEELLSEYYSCFPFVLKMAQLYLNYFPKSTDQQSILERVLQLSSRVKNLSGDLALVNEATMLEAFTYLQQGKPEEVLSLLGKDVQIQFGSDHLISTAHNMLGNLEKAKETIQISYYQNLMQLLSKATEAMMLELENADYIDETIYKIKELIRLFDLENLNFNTVLIFYYKAAKVYTLKGQSEQAIEMLRSYVKLCKKIQFPIKLKGNAYFYLLSQWIENTAQLSSEAPRDEQSVKKDLVQTIVQNPAFDSLKKHPSYQAMIRNLADYLKVEVNR
ncbi:helix-turn-helix domain-containing protein [Halobacillus salinarum]|uniref:Helix-turn-helix domain-containing protein n=1 Tax=Halobacillus salinarum TaxID=2932257 RepID=A0ABY4EK41_9BACI|nr:helix-turn-helix transcriptional regulator [Halobacillus salinarum]UOQ44844.1 helix-turn-helix domain-containing protein [Halobacillus salinarum]